MAYEVLARRYRPVGFEELVGQASVRETLENAISLDRIAHAYLFSGPRGVGKTSTARIFAKALNVTGDEKLDKEVGEAIMQGKAVDVIEIDGASNNGVENIREIREAANYAPMHSRFKIYIIDEVHMVTKAAFNALLKTLEEPPEHIVFIFATTEAHKVPDTIISRCQRFDFRALSEKDIFERLKEIVECERVKDLPELQVSDETLTALARLADGGMRDAQSCLDQLITYAGGLAVKEEHLAELFCILTEDEVLKALEAAQQKDFSALSGMSRSFLSRGVQVNYALNQFHRMLRELMRIKHLRLEGTHIPLPQALRDRALNLARSQSTQGFLAAIDFVQQSKSNLSRGMDAGLALEMVLMNLGHLGELPTLSELMALVVGSKKKT